LNRLLDYLDYLINIHEGNWCQVSIKTDRYNNILAGEMKHTKK